MSVKYVFVLALVAACAGEKGDDGQNDDAADADTDADSDADTDADADSDADADTDPPGVDADADGWTVDQDCDDADPAVLGLVTVDDVPFGDLGSALAAATDGATVSVCQGTHTGPFVASVPVQLVSRDGSATTILTGGGDRVLALPGGSTVSGFTLREGVAVGDGGGLALTSVGTLDVDDCVVENNTADQGGGIAVAEGSDATFTRTVIRQNRARSGGGLFVPTGATVDLGDTDLSGNEALEYGGGARLDGGTVLGGTFHRNEADGQAMNGGPYLGGGAISATGDVRIERSVLTENVASAGGGLEVTDGAATLLDVEVSTNVNLVNFGDGGGVRCLRCSLALDGTTTIYDNGALATTGGGIWINEGTVTGGLVTGNTAQDGAGIYAIEAALTDIDILDNTSLSIDGGVVIYGYVATVVGCDISGNSAQQYAGGGTIGGVDVTITDTRITDNVAGESGGGLYVYGHNLRIEGSTIEGNSAQYGGGGLWITAPFSVVDVVDSTVRNNDAAFAGGAWLGNGSVMSSEATDWGTGADDNVPEDVLVTESDNGYGGGPPPVGVSLSGYGEDATFDCDAAGCTPTP